MKTFRLERPPETPGVYVLKNIKTLQVYVGCTANLRRRFAAWGGGAYHKAAIPEHVLRIFKSSPPEDWVFVILKEGTKQDHAHLRQVEEAAIEKLSKSHPDKLLNNHFNFNARASYLTPPKLPMSGLPRAAGSGAPKTDLRSVDGRRMTYVEAAYTLNIRQSTLKRRLRKLRAKGATQVSIGDLT